MISTFVFVSLLATTALSVIGVFVPKLHLPVRIGIVLTLVVFIVQFVMRSISIGFVSVVGQYDGLSMITIGILGVAFVGDLLGWFKKRPELIPAVLTAAFVFTALANSPLISSDIAPPVPILRSSWLVLHVVLTFIGEAFFAVAFVTSLVWFFSKDEKRKKALDTLTYRAVMIGYPLFTTGALIFGAIWAEQAWGRYWGWDPKEVWALVTWIAYSIYLHFRLRGKKYATLAHWSNVLGFALAMFTLFGVNLIFSGLHSY